ncbi:peptidase domain-containing ABC transporter [Candidatus Thiodubiliella endoseptemdiera]|uniref:Peptidase domain-containing ABC transporter n=1 Tax=Candidatus Thiodubiliella endoseptemdiera TaxID=2738886 RepID=A0A853EY96_9GAMM|nr:peptidase domain-containing ABC transporter [Candidatus Thiodubiliella endoseptemdiera]
MQQVYQSVYTLFLLLREEVLGKDIIAQNSENSETTLDEDKLHLFAKQNKLKLQFSKEKFSAKKLQKKAPFIFFTKDNLPAVVASISQEGVLIQRPGEAPAQFTLADIQKVWGGKVIFVKDTNKFGLEWFLPEFLRYRNILLEIISFSCILKIIALVLPLIFQVVVDKVVVNNALSTMVILLVALLSANIFEVALTGIREYLLLHTANRIDIGLGMRLFKHLIHLPIAFFENKSVGLLVSRAQEIDSVREFFTGKALLGAIDFLFLFVTFFVMYYISPKIALVTVATVPFYFIGAWLLTPKLIKHIELSFSKSAKNTAFLTESISNSETIKSMALERVMLKRWNKQTDSMVEVNYALQKLNTSASQVVSIFSKVVGVLVLWLAATEVFALSMTIGQLIAFNMLLSMFQQPLNQLISLWQEFLQTKIAIERLSSILNTPAERKQHQNPHKLQGKIELRDVSFKYTSTGNLVLEDINLIIAPGESVALVGGSGSGKSTIAKLIQGLYTPDSGEIYIDDINLNKIDVHSLREQIGVVLQDNYLFQESVRENIAHKDPTLPLEQVIEAAKTSGADDFIRKMQLGYNTEIQEGGKSLSGGQRQRIAFARAIVDKPKLLILDEATSALDEESQALIRQNMAKISLGKTVIIIAHRLSTIKSCDRVVVINKGKITNILSGADKAKYLSLIPG